MGDKMTEMLVGEPGAIRLRAALVVMPMGVIEVEDKTRIKVGLWGSAFTPLARITHPMSDGYQEMWHCDIIIIPRLKHSSHKAGQQAPEYAYANCRADQILCAESNGGFGNPDNWGDEYFQSKPDSEA